MWWSQVTYLPLSVRVCVTGTGTIVLQPQSWSWAGEIILKMLTNGSLPNHNSITWVHTCEWCTGECPKTSLMISQDWFRQWLGASGSKPLPMLKEREVSRIFDIGHWTFECPMSKSRHSRCGVGRIFDRRCSFLFGGTQDRLIGRQF